MEQELIKSELDVTIIEKDEDVEQYIYSLLESAEQFYIAIKSGTYDKVLMIDTERVYQFHKDNNSFKLSELCLNTEEDYIVLELVDINDGNIPVFKISTTQAELSTFQYLYHIYIKYPYYSWKFKKDNKSVK